MHKLQQNREQNIALTHVLAVYDISCTHGGYVNAQLKFHRFRLGSTTHKRECTVEESKNYNHGEETTENNESYIRYWIIQGS